MPKITIDKILISLPTFTEEEILQFLRAQADKGETTSAKYLYNLLPKSVEYLRKISRLKRRDKRYHEKLLKDRFREIIEELVQSNLISIQEEAKARYLTVADSRFKPLESSNSSLLRKKESFPAQSVAKSLKFTNKIPLLIVALIIWTFYWSLFVQFFESNYLLPISVLFEHHPWLTLYFPGLSTLFTAGSMAIIYAIIKAYNKNRTNKKLGIVKSKGNIRLIFRKLRNGLSLTSRKRLENLYWIPLLGVPLYFLIYSRKKLEEKTERPKTDTPSQPRESKARAIKKNLFWIPLLGVPSYFSTYLLALWIHTLLYRGYYMLPFDYLLPIEYVYQAYPFMELTSHIIGIVTSSVLTSVVAHYYNRSIT